MIKGITPVIATILLLLIAVAIVGIAFVFFSRTTQTASEDVERQSRQQLSMMSTSFGIDSVYQNKVYIRNKGRYNVSNISFYINNTIIESDNAIVPPGDVIAYTLNPSQINSFRGQRVQMRAVSGLYSHTVYTKITGTPEPVVWTNAVGVAVSGNNLTKTAPTTYWGDAGASSTKQISGNGYVEFTLIYGGDCYVMLGLNDGDASQSISDIDYAIYQYPAAAQLWVYEKGIGVLMSGPTYAQNDVIRVSVDDGVVRYWRNGVVFYTSAMPATAPLRADTSLYDYNTAMVKNAMIYGDLTSV